jgi:hypothetical protein
VGRTEREPSTRPAEVAVLVAIIEVVCALVVVFFVA